MKSSSSSWKLHNLGAELVLWPGRHGPPYLVSCVGSLLQAQDRVPVVSASHGAFGGPRAGGACSTGSDSCCGLIGSSYECNMVRQSFKQVISSDSDPWLDRIYYVPILIFNSKSIERICKKKPPLLQFLNHALLAAYSSRPPPPMRLQNQGSLKGSIAIYSPFIAICSHL